jgi:hypothetical protein
MTEKMGQDQMVTAATARIIAAADEARRRIERDLHDGLQQRLVSLLLRAALAEASVPADRQDLKRELASIGDGLEEALEAVREISRGLHPAILSEAGLGPAVKALARGSPVPVTLHAGVAGRLPERVEIGAYYIISEALANAAKHAQASAVVISVEQRGHALDLSVRDDGIGGADRSGPGLTGLADRVHALAGTMQLVSPPGHGTHLRISLPTGSSPARWASAQPGRSPQATSTEPDPPAAHPYPPPPDQQVHQGDPAMVISAQAQQFAAHLEDMRDRANGLDLATSRYVAEAGFHLSGAEPEGVSYAEVDAGGVPAIWCIPAGADEQHALVHFHNGGAVVASAASDRKGAAHLAKAAGVRSLVIDFRLAPEHKHPAQLDDAERAFAWLAGQGYQPSNIASTGHSGGGYLAIALALRLRDQGKPLPAAVVSMSPWVDLTITN